MIQSIILDDLYFVEEKTIYVLLPLRFHWLSGPDFHKENISDILERIDAFPSLQDLGYAIGLQIYY